MGADPSPPLLHLTLEILYMQLREDFIIMRKSGGRLAVRGSSAGSEDQRPSMEPERNKKKILEVANQITELLTGEVPIRCQDVAVYLSMEEREYLEEQKDLYSVVMMEAEPHLTSAGSTDGLHPSPTSRQDCSGEDDDIVITVQASNYWSADDQIMVAYLENFLNISTDKEHDPQLERNSFVDPMNAWSTHTEDLRRTRMKSISLDHAYCFSYTKAKSLMYRERLQSNPNPTPTSRWNIKVEHLDEEACLQHSNISTTVDSTEYTTVVIKEDTYSCGEEPLPHIVTATPDECGQYRPLHIKEEPITCEEPLAYSGTNTITSPTTHNPLNIKEEPLAYEVEVPAEIELYTDGTLFSKTYCKPKQTRRLEDHPFSCNICKKRFKQKSGLGMHVKIHAKEEHFTCPDCGRCFNSQSSLWEHQSIHYEEKPYSCLECGKRFSKATNLSNHQRIHATKNPFSCSDCGKQFVSNNNLRRHQKKHSTEMSNNQEFYCLKCNKLFTDKPAFQRHQRYHTGDNPYPCAECGRRFVKRINLIKHQRFHTRKNLHSCQECGKFFMSGAYLARHMKSHTKKKRPCSCSVCGKYFTSSLELISHQKVHNAENPGTTSEWRNSFIRKLGVVMQERNSVEEKPYLCPDCGELFERKLQLIRHQKTHIKEETLT